MDELICWLILRTGWALEYTINLIKTLPIKKLNALIQEFQFQKSLEDYKAASNFAMIVANWASAQGKRRYRIHDFIGQSPQRPYSQDILTDAAQREGIILPKE